MLDGFNGDFAAEFGAVSLSSGRKPAAPKALPALRAAPKRAVPPKSTGYPKFSASGRCVQLVQRGPMHCVAVGQKIDPKTLKPIGEFPIPEAPPEAPNPFITPQVRGPAELPAGMVMTPKPQEAMPTAEVGPTPPPAESIDNIPPALLEQLLAELPEGISYEEFMAYVTWLQETGQMSTWEGEAYFLGDAPGSDAFGCRGQGFGCC